MGTRRTLLTLGFVAFVTSFGAHVVAVNLPVYAKHEGVGLLMIGVLIAAYDFAEIFAKPAAGFLADRDGLKPTMLFGLAFFSFASLAYLFVNPNLLIVIRFLQGLGAAALSIASAALVATYFADARGKAFGIYNAMKGAGYVLSPLVGGAIVWRSSFAMIFLASFLLGALAWALALALPRPASNFLPRKDKFSRNQFFSAFRERHLFRWYATIVINMFMVGILFGFLPVYIYSLGYNQLQNGMIVAVATISYLVSQPIAGWVADRFGSTHVILAGLVLSAAGIALVPFTAGPGLVAVAMTAGIGVGAVWTTTDAIVSTLASKERLAATLGAAGSFKELGDMLGPLIIGILAQSVGIKSAFVICGALGLLAVGLLSAEWTSRR